MRGLTAAVGFCTLAAAGFLVATRDVDLTTLALLIAGAILAEALQPEPDRLLGPIEADPFRVPAAIQIAAVIVLGPWAGAVVGAAGVLAVTPLRGYSWRAVSLETATVALAAPAAGLGFRLGGGHSGSLAIPHDLVAVAALCAAYAVAAAFLRGVAGFREPLRPETLIAAGEAGLGVIAALLALTDPWSVVLLVPVALAVQHAHHRAALARRESARALETFANIVDERDASTYRHSARVADYVGGLAEALGYPPADVARLRWAGRLHDLGKMAVDAEVLRKSTPLDGAEWAAIRRAPRLSARLLQRFRFAAEQAQAVEFHHERLDGAGYYGVPGEDLPLASHFLIVADAFDAMTTDRPYRPGLSTEAALREIEQNVGTQFHPTVAKAFVAMQRGTSPTTALTPAELRTLRAATVRHRLPRIPAARDPEAVALAGVLLVLLGVAAHFAPAAAAGVGLTALGLGQRTLGAARAARVAGSIRKALGAEERSRVFEAVVQALARPWAITWAGLVVWSEDGLGGAVEAEHGEDAPDETALLSWLIRHADAAESEIVAGPHELRRDGVHVALPLRRDNSALAGFLVLSAARPPPRPVALALRSCLGELGLALAPPPFETALPAESTGTRIVCEGEDVSLVTWGAVVEAAHEAARALAEDGVSVEIVDVGVDDLWSRETVLASARKTAKILIAGNGGLDAEIAATLAEEAFEHLDAPVRRVPEPSVHELVAELSELAAY